MDNIVLIGMPGAGKSTIGVLLAKTMLKSFCDTDLLIQQKYAMSLSDIIKKEGIDKFLQIENDVIAGNNFENSVIATGGSAVYGKQAMEQLKSNGRIVYLKVKPEELEKRVNNIHTRGIAMKEGTTLGELYLQRAGLYEEYADVIVECEFSTPEECVDKIINLLEKE